MAGLAMGSPMRWTATRPQIAAVALVTVVAALLGVILPGQTVNLRLSANDTQGAIMPPGMIMTRDTPAAAMRDMAAVDPDEASYTAPASARGDQPLRPQLVDGVKVFRLEASVIRWHILSNRGVYAYAFNHQVPGPRIELTEGDRVRIVVTNHLPEPTTVHWHGLVVPNAMDGPAEITQTPIRPGHSYSYEYTVRQAGTFMYHTHDHADRQQALGLYGALIVEPKDPALDRRLNYQHDVVIELQEWLVRDGLTYPAMLMEGGLPNFFTINGKAYPDTQPIRMRVGERVRIRFIGTNHNFVHPPDAHSWWPVRDRRHRRQPSHGWSAPAQGHGRRRPGRTLRRHLDRTQARQVAPPLPHPPPHHQRQRRRTGRRRSHDHHRSQPLK